MGKLGTDLGIRTWNMDFDQDLIRLQVLLCWFRDFNDSDLEVARVGFRNLCFLHVDRLLMEGFAFQRRYWTKRDSIDLDVVVWMVLSKIDNTRIVKLCFQFFDCRYLTTVMTFKFDLCRGVQLCRLRNLAFREFWEMHQSSLQRCGAEIEAVDSKVKLIGEPGKIGWEILDSSFSVHVSRRIFSVTVWRRVGNTRRCDRVWCNLWLEIFGC